MFTLASISKILCDTSSKTFDEYGVFTEIENQVEWLETLFSNELWQNRDPDLRNIEDKKNTSLVSNIFNGKNPTSSGIPKFRQKVTGIILSAPQILRQTAKQIFDLINNAKINEKEFYDTFSKYINNNVAIDEYAPQYIELLNATLNQNNTAVFLMWLCFGALVQTDIEKLTSLFDMQIFPDTDDDYIYEYLIQNRITIYNSPKSSFVADIPEKEFWNLRKLVISEARDELIISGQSLMDAFDNNNSINIISSIKDLIENHHINNLHILTTDPTIFSIKPNCTSPLIDIDKAITTIIDSLLPCCKKYDCHLDLYFIPLLEIDHAVITNKYMLLRTTKLWTEDRKYKGAFGLYKNSSNSSEAPSEYAAQNAYIKVVMDNCTKINPNSDTYTKVDTPALEMHNKWRKRIASMRYTCITLHKLYNSQLVNYVVNGWTKELTLNDSFAPSDTITCHEDLFNPENLLNDQTQKALLPYIKETQNLLNQVVKDYDSSEKSGAIIYPSLDLGYPNNVQRLAGGFATGMFVHWECGTDIIPVDATVNVCSSSVFKIDHFNPNQLGNNFQKYLNDEIFINASNTKGYSFSFESGNHFLMIAKDKNNDYYLVLHSSANEFKNSYMGLYPIENNWYSDKIKTFRYNNRYLRYIKDKEARHFATKANHLLSYNEQIHSWLANKINNDSLPSESIIKHHYYMPTHSSIAIGTFVESPGTVVPMFSSVGKPVYLFRVGKDNWKISLEGEDKCLIPHGWGQQIETIKEVSVDKDRNMLFLDSKNIPVTPQERINHDDKHIREFNSGEEFLKIGKRIIKGEIEKVLYPEYLF